MSMKMHDSSKRVQKIIVKIDPELIELIPAFLENRGTDIQLMNKALKASDYEIIERTGHGMKGAGAGFGFEAITEIGAALEKAAQDKDSELIQKGIDALSHYVQNLEIIYE